jgi:hypothetical protein
LCPFNHGRIYLPRNATRLHSHMVTNINILVVHRYGYINIHDTRIAKIYNRMVLVFLYL